jgi:hypothetical protein
MISTLRSDPTTSGEEHFRLVLVQTEMERAKFLVRSYVRTRLWKVSMSTDAWVRSRHILHPLAPVHEPCAGNPSFKLAIAIAELVADTRPD